MPDIKKVRCIETGEIYDNIKIAGNAVACSHTIIRNVIRGKQASFRGLTFELVDEVRSPELISEFVLRDVTFNKYGYYPEYLSKNSRSQIIVKCPCCKKEYSRVRQKYTSGSPCTSCTYSNLLRKAAISKRKPKKEKPPQYPKPPKEVRQFENRIRSSMSRICKNNTSWRKLGNLTHLDYSSIELYNHIKEELNHGCCICCKPIYGNNFHIAHIIPSSSAQTKKDVLLLYSLLNLSVAHPRCNMSLSNRIVVPKLLPAC
jgi:hypothetical protein